MEKIANTVRKLIGTIEITFGFLTLLIAAPVSLLFRRFIVVLARIRRPHLAEMMCGMSQIFALESYKAESSFNFILYIVCDGTISLDSLRQQFLTKLMPRSMPKLQCDPYARLRQVWAKYMGFLFWQWDRDFRVEKHVRLYDHASADIALPGEVCSEEELQCITAPLVTTPFATGKSPWEFLLIENYKSNDNNDGHPQCVIVMRMHHALLDGISLLKMILRLFDNETVDTAQARFPQLSLAKIIGSNLLVALCGPYDFASKYFVDCYDDSSNCWYMEDKQRQKEYHAFFSKTVQVGKIKEIMKKYNVCYNATLYSVTAGAIVKLMEEAGQEVPAKLSWLYSYPLQAHPGGLDNYVSSDLFAFRPLLHASPGERLAVISKSVRPARVFTTVPVVTHSMEVLITPLTVKLIGLMYNRYHVTLCITGVAGPRNELTLLGNAKLVEFIPVLGHLRSSVGALAAMASVGPRQRIVLTVHRAIFEGYKPPCNFASYVEEEIEQLLR